MRLKQAGFSGAAVMMAMAAAGLTTISVQSYQAKNKQSIDAAEKALESQNNHDVLQNAASRFKALIAPKAVGGRNIPAYFASNYFDEKWNLRYRANSTTGVTAAGSRAVSFNLNANYKDDLREATDIFKGTKTAAVNGSQPFTIEILDTNRESDTALELVTSVDIKVSTMQNGKPISAKYRVPVPAPDAKNPSLKYKRQGANDSTFKPVTGNLELDPGQYEFKAFVDGIVHHAKIVANGSEYKMGWAGTQVAHTATAWDADNTGIGSSVILTVGKPDLDESIEFDKTSCTATLAEEVLTIPGANTIRFEVMGVDGKPVPGQFNNVDFTVKHKESAVPHFGFVNVTPEDYENKCADKCPYVGPKVDPNVEADLMALHHKFANETRGFNNASNAKAGDLAAAWTYEWAHKYLISTQKLCVNMDKPGLDLSNTDYFHNADFILYSVKTCKRKFLMTRTTCGCVSEDTKILMGDGKTEKRIDSIVEGETVWNPVLKKAMPIKYLSRGPEKIPMLTLKTTTGELNATGNHPFPTPSGMKTTFQLEVGDKIRLANGSWSIVEDIAVKRAEGKDKPIVWNIEIDAPADNWDAHHYVANGIDTGDLLIQRMMESSLAKN